MENYDSDFNNPKILIVEDECLTAIELKNKLNDYKYDILSPVQSGEEAIEISNNAKPDLILMDIMLAGKINGIEAANEIKKFLDIPIIYLTAYGDYETLQNAKITEPHAYTLKPFNEKEVMYAIEIALHKHEMELKLKEKEKKFRLLYYKAPLAYQLLDEDGYIIDVNQAWINALGYSLDEVVGHHFAEFLFYDGREFKENWEYYKETGIQRKEFVLLCKYGSNLDIELEIKRVYDGDMDPKHLSIFYIISHHKYEQEKIKESLIQKEILLEEISLQLQNNYNNVHNLIKSESSEIIENIELENDISSNLIYNNELETVTDDIAFVDFSQYIESLVEDLIFSNDLDKSLNVNLSVDNVMLGLETSLSYGLILIEILKNSINNLHLDKKKYTVNIDFQLLNNKLILKINDNFNDYSKILESNNSSFKLINRLVKQHHGIIGLDKNNFSEIQIIFGLNHE